MMKYIQLFIISFFVIFFPFTMAAASQVGNVANPAELSSGVFTYERSYGIASQIEADIVSDKKYLDQDGNFEFNFYGAKTGAILMDSLFGYAVLGMAKYSDNKVMTNYSSLPDNDSTGAARNEQVDSVVIDTDPGFVFGLGISSVMYEKKINEGVFLRFGLDAQYRHVELEDNSAKINLTSFQTYGSGSSSTTTHPFKLANYQMMLEEFQAALELSYQIDNFTPYFGFKLAQSKGHEEFSVSSDSYYDYRGDMKLDENKGYFVGISYNVKNKLMLNLEARARDESAISFSAAVRF